MMYFMFSLMTSIAMMMMFMKHPLSMGFMLILQTLVVAMITGMIMKSFMMSYIIMIIMLSGALVLFIYMASVASNEKFQTSVKMFFMFIMSSMMSYFMMNKTSGWGGYSEMMEMKSFTKLFNSMSASMTIMMMLYLLFTMIVVSNIADINKGPLRMKK
uniref:NADH dehydrogenase subunit 6 n=1 Tax=Megacopta centronubila TaxID=2968963 RepID=UPI00223721EB|nr:NADH dehydrogenase subunit 6 [Megacopta centronubila]UYA97704.1 NADH dehydrogenase subunit 6 [Megacopta centronubila]UYA97717.1 NADH dehydrogenase subunit 6 [Megacopta centronubila]